MCSKIADGETMSDDVQVMAKDPLANNFRRWTIEVLDPAVIAAAQEAREATRRAALLEAGSCSNQQAPTVSATGAASDAAVALRERGEKLGSLASKTDELNESASNFAAMAKQLRQQQEQRWF